MFESSPTSLDTSRVSSGANAYPDGMAVAHELAKQIAAFESLLRESASDQAANSPSIEELRTQFSLIKDFASTTASQLHETRQRSESLARAQADAIVYSAEVIGELEETKLRLNEARAAAEKAANDTQRLADTIFDRTNDAVLILMDNKCVSCNDNALEMFGCQKYDLLDRWPVPFNVENLQDGQTSHEFLRRSLDRAREGETQILEVQLYRADRTLIWCEIKMTGFHMREVRHVLITARDITTRKEFEEELRRNHNFLHNVINAVPDALFVSDEESKILVANDSYCESFRVDQSSVIGTALTNSLPIAPIENANERCCSKSSDAVSEQLVQIADETGQRLHAVRQSVFCDMSSGKKYVVGVARDVTLEREHQKRLHLLAGVFKHASEGVAILNTEGLVLEANPRLCEMLQSPQLTGQYLLDSIKLSMKDFMNELVEVAHGKPWSGKVSGVTSDGREHWYWLSLGLNDSNADCEAQIIALFSDVTQLENSERQLKKQAMHDNLTGLPNRAYFRQYIDELVQRSNVKKSTFYVCFMDLDDFKIVNDSLGHGVGDQLLIAVAQRLTDTVGSQAFIARFGGDEFAAVFPQRRATDESIDSCIKRLVQEFQTSFCLGQHEVNVGLSVGLSQFSQECCDTETLMANADIAMYAAKTAGKNHARMFSPEMQERADQRHMLLAELRKVLQGGGITLAFQPKACLKTGKLKGCEALARWQRPDGSMVSPAEFIPIAEQSGVILPLGEHVICKALEVCRDWHSRGVDLFPMAINISPQQLRSVSFVDRLMELLAEYDAKPEWLDIEITENAMVDDIEHAIETLNRLKSHGFGVAIDDFGTGYSSLSYLRFFSLSTLKIDRLFVSEIEADKNSMAIAQSIVSLGHGLGLTVVAEGVETKEQARVLANAGCDVIQGYYLAKPMHGPEIESWSKTRTADPEWLSDDLPTS